MALRGMRDLVFVLPIVCVDLLTKSPKPMQSQGFPNSSNFVFETIWETVKSGSTPVGGPVKSGRKQTKEESRGLDKRLVQLELVTAWIQ